MTNIMSESISGGNIMDTFILDPVTEYGGMFEDGSAMLQQYLEEAITGTTKKNLPEKMLDLFKKILKVISNTLRKIPMLMASVWPGYRVIWYTWDGSSDYVLFKTPYGTSCEMKIAFLAVCLHPEMVDNVIRLMEEDDNRYAQRWVAKFIDVLQETPEIEPRVTKEFPVRNIEKLSKSVAKAIPIVEGMREDPEKKSNEVLLFSINFLLGLLRKLSENISWFYAELTEIESDHHGDK